uniref:Uncharacterized protein n=1 Tax=Lepeophtheirus salmonis TaxID=72036 RepID=A0A0K2T2Q7_LEPSM
MCGRGHGPVGRTNSSFKMVLMYSLLMIFTPAGANTKGDFPVSVTAFQSITDCGLCTLLIPWSPSSPFLGRIRSFWGLKAYSIVKIFSSLNTCQSSVFEE